ncbi:MAG: transporter [Rhodospirillales bacterium]|nr:transporter [Rhodospirillales bacterium]
MPKRLWCFDAQIAPNTLLFSSLVELVCLAGTSEALADSISTRHGDRLTGRILAVGCDGVEFAYRDDQRLAVPLDAISGADSTSAVSVVLTDGDRLTGLVGIRAGAVSISSAVFGRVTVKAQDLAARTDRGSKSSSCIRASAEVAPVPTRDLARLTGTGGDAAIDSSAASPSTESTPPATPAASLSPTHASHADVPSAGSASAAPPAEDEAEPLQFLRTEAVLLPPLRLEGDLVLSYLRNNESVQNDKLVSVTPALRFGMIANMEGFVQMPYSWGRREINTFAGVERNDVDGIGDVRFGLKYSVVPQSATIPNVVAAVSASAPTGNAPYLKPPPGAPSSELSRDLRDPFTVQLGTGHWSVSGGVTAIKAFDPLILFATANYTHFFPATYYGVRIEPGDFWDANAGLGFAVNDTGTLSSQVFVGYQEEWEFEGTHVAETSSSPISLRFAYTHILSSRDLIEPSVFFGLTGDANDALVSVGYSHTF